MKVAESASVLRETLFAYFSFCFKSKSCLLLNKTANFIGYTIPDAFVENVIVRSHSRREIVQYLDTGIDIAIDITYNTKLSFVIHSVMTVARSCKHGRKRI